VYTVIGQSTGNSSNCPARDEKLFRPTSIRSLLCQSPRAISADPSIPNYCGSPLKPGRFRARKRTGALLERRLQSKIYGFPDLIRRHPEGVKDSITPTCSKTPKHMLRALYLRGKHALDEDCDHFDGVYNITYTQRRLKDASRRPSLVT